MYSLIKKFKELRRDGVLHDIDLEFCHFVRKEYEVNSREVILAVCLVSYLYRQGDVCLLLTKYADQSIFDNASGDNKGLKAPDLESWKKALERSSIVGTPGDYKPLILDSGNRLYLHKLWHYEDSLAKHLKMRSEQKPPEVTIASVKEAMGRLFPNDNSREIDWQQVAAAVSVRNKLSIISGGPGTGKTSTVVRILALLLEINGEEKPPAIALAAPTGKAAARLKGSLSSAKASLDLTDEIKEAIPDDTMTLHQLLGARRHSSSFKYDAENPVPYDIVIVDEASMVDQALMSKLLNALLEDCRLILLGDKDQLASVEAGSVLGDICSVDRNNFSTMTASWLKQLSLNIPDECIVERPKTLTDHITLLIKSYRFDAESGIARLADCVNRGDAEQAIKILGSKRYPDTSLISITDQSRLEEVIRRKISRYFEDLVKSDSVDEALQIFNEFRILAAHRRGPWGVNYLNQYVERILLQQGLITKYREWYPGKPVIVNVNDYSLDLHNGDTGICLPDQAGELKLFFPYENSIRAVSPARLPDHSTAYALTVHKSQGSEYEEVLFILPNKLSKVLSRELIYTAITRSRTSITILGKELILQRSVEKKLERSSGLKSILWGN